jgi:hypothetical protein
MSIVSFLMHRLPCSYRELKGFTKVSFILDVLQPRQESNKKCHTSQKLNQYLHKCIQRRSNYFIYRITANGDTILAAYRNKIARTEISKELFDLENLKFKKIKK